MLHKAGAAFAPANVFIQTDFQEKGDIKLMKFSNIMILFLINKFLQQIISGLKRHM